jgi:hypothetical protein
MELIIIAGAVVLGAVVYYNWNNRRSLDLNQDGEVTVADAKIAVDNVKQGIAADIVKVKTAARATAKRIAEKKPAAKKPAAKKAPAKAPAKKPAAKKK